MDVLGSTSTCLASHVANRRESQEAFQWRENTTDRQLARVSAISFLETSCFALFPGNRHTVCCLRPAVLDAGNALEVAPAQRKPTVWPMDGGAEPDEKMRWLLARDYQIRAKGISNHRANALASSFTAGIPTVIFGWVNEIRQLTIAVPPECSCCSPTRRTICWPISTIVHWRARGLRTKAPNALSVTC